MFSGFFVYVADVYADVDLGAKLTGRAFGVVEEQRNFLICIAFIAFSDIAGDGEAGSGDLVPKAKVLVIRHGLVEVCAESG